MCNPTSDAAAIGLDCGYTDSGYCEHDLCPSCGAGALVDSFYAVLFCAVCGWAVGDTSGMVGRG